MTATPDSVNALLLRVDKALQRTDLSEQTRTHYAVVGVALTDAVAIIGQLENKILDLEAKLKPLPARLGDLSDLPQELLAELSAPRGDELESQILVVIQACGGTADLDRILVGLFRKFKVIQKRRFLQNKVWRMCQKEMIWSIRGRKGLYTINEPADDEKESVSPTQEAPEDFDF